MASYLHADHSADIVRFLWTNGQSSPQSFLLWDTQVINAAPSSILWRQGGREITVRVPGLYKITVAVFAPVVGSDEGENDRNKRGGGGGTALSYHYHYRTSFTVIFSSRLIQQ